MTATILAIDDDPVQLQLTETFLTQAGYSVATARNETEAFEKARAQRPAAILSDVLMGDLDGFTLCSQFRREPAFRDVPVVLVSAYFHGDDDRQLAASAGAAALVERTPMFEEELAALRRVLQTGAPAYVDQPAMPELYVRRMAACLARFAADMRRAELRYRTLLDHASDFIGILKPDGTILDTNRRWERTLNLTRDQLIGRHIGEFAAPGHEKSNVERYRGALDMAVAEPIVNPIRRPDGSTLFIEFSQAAVEIDGETQVLTIGRDVTDAREARRRLEASERQYRALVENIPDVVWTAQFDGTITFASPQAEGVSGYRLSEIVGAPASFWFDRIHPDDIDRVRRAYEALKSAGRYECEYRWQRKDGTWIWVRVNAVAAVSLDGHRIAEGTLADITEQKNLEDQFRQSQKMDALGQLTGGIAHDFNNLLAIILGNGRMLLDDLEAGDERRADAQAIVEAGERASALTRQLLTFSRRQVVQPKDLDLNAIVIGLEKMLRRVIGEDIKLTIACRSGIGAIHADAGEIEQVILNLVLNARDAMPAGGTLRIETATADLDEEYVRTHVGAHPGPHVALMVSDTGRGMDAETQRHLFEPFFTTKDKGRGTGLGLSTCYGIVNRSKGHIWAYSELGHGTVFKVFLPRLESELATAPPASAVRADYSGTETVLIVEDDAPLRSTVSRILARRGYRVMAAGDGRDAIALVDAGQSTIDLVVSDVIMPGMTGPDVVEAIRARVPRVRALFMSGYTEHPLLRDNVTAAGVHFIQKPFAPQAFAAKVREVLDA